MRLENGELKMLSKFRMYIKITEISCTNVCNEVGITAPTFRTIMEDERYIPSKNVRNKISFFMNKKLLELKKLVDD